MSQVIEREFKTAGTTPSDINEHVGRLRYLASKCDHIVEGGVRYVVSTWAFLFGCACRGGTVVSYCWTKTPEIQRAIDICATEGISWEFHEGDWLMKEVPETDLLFIDTNHEAWQLQKELQLHAPKARRFLVLHDTATFGEVGADGKRPGLMGPINDLVQEGQWLITDQYSNCNGLTILEREANL